MVRAHLPASRMIEPHPASARRPLVRAWLYAVAALMVLTLVVGGATRLTESGLSIVEWKPVTGVLPPLSQAGVAGRIRQVSADPAIPRAQPRHEPRPVQDHLLVGVDATGCWRGWSARPSCCRSCFFSGAAGSSRGLRTRLWTLFGAGALLGAVGWWMVSSGLAGRVSVSQYRLAFHLTLACAIYAAHPVDRARALGARPERRRRARLRATAIGLVVLVLLQIYLGALVAGLDAGLIFNTWPRIDGALIPSAERLWFESPLWRNLFENTLTVQFNHRMVAYALWLVAMLHAVDVIRARRGGAMLNGALALACAVTIQAGIGIVTLLHQAPLPLALLHQAMAIVVLTIAVVHAERLSPRHAAARCRAADRRRRLHPARNEMIELTQRGAVAVVTLVHGKANALDIEFCEAIAAQFEALRSSAAQAVVLTGQGRMFSAGVDLLRLSEGGAALRPALPAGAAPALRHGVLLPQAGGGRGQRPRHRRRLRAGNAAPTSGSPRATAAASA